MKQQGIYVVFYDEKSRLMSLTDVMCNVCNVVFIFNIVMTEPTGSFDGSEPGSPLPEPAAASASLPALQHLLLYPQVCTGNNENVYVHIIFTVSTQFVNEFNLFCVLILQNVLFYTAQPRRERAQRRPREQPSEVDRQLLEALRTRPAAPAPPPRSEDELFLLSLVPSLQRLPPQTKEFVKFKIHKLIYESSKVLLHLEQLDPIE